MSTHEAKDVGSVEDYLASLDDGHSVDDCRALIDMMRRISGHEPTMWNVGTIGFDSYHFRYDSGREGDCHALGFYARARKMTVYLMDGTARHAELLGRLGRHTTSRVCVYIKQLADIELSVLEQILRDSYEHVKSQDGHMYRVVE